MDVLAQGEPGRGKRCFHCNFHDFHSLSKENQVSFVSTILFEIITFLIRKPLNHGTVIAKNSRHLQGGIFFDMHSAKKTRKL